MQLEARVGSGKDHPGVDEDDEIAPKLGCIFQIEVDPNGTRDGLQNGSVVCHQGGQFFVHLHVRVSLISYSHMGYL